MCSVSVIQDYARQWVPVQDWTRPAWDEYQEILRLLRKFDERHHQPDCEDPAKAAWMRDVEARLAALENPEVVRGPAGGSR